MTLAKRVGDATLRSNPSFVPKNLRSSFKSRVIPLDACCPPPHVGIREAKLHLLCIVYQLACCVEHTDGMAEEALFKKQNVSVFLRPVGGQDVTITLLSVHTKHAAFRC